MTDKEVKELLKKIRKEIPDNRQFKRTLRDIGVKKDKLDDVLNIVDNLE